VIQFCRALGVVLMLLASSVGAEDRMTRTLDYAPAPIDNPLKGLVPYVSAYGKERFPHSMEFRYFPLKDVMKGPGEFDWGAIERTLVEANNRGNQLVFRVYCEYPGKPLAVPSFLVDAGVEVTTWIDEDDGKTNRTPDYGNRALREALAAFISAMGSKYDGDPRVAFITAGLLGKWGEWHNYPREDLWASKQVQREVMDAYARTFSTTPILLRYPAGPKTYWHAENHERPFGYHDDSFCWATLDTGKKKDSWFFETSMKAAGATEKWKRYPIGGEIRPELWRRSFTDNRHSRDQGFVDCVERMHVSWLMDTGLFSKRYPMDRERKDTALREVARMGYEFHVRQVTWLRNDGFLDVAVEIENRGVAPFYYEWPIEFGLLSEDSVARSCAGKGKLTGLLPGDEVRVWKGQLALEGVAPGQYQLAMRIPNPMPQGVPLRFANTTQDQHIPGWLTLVDLSL